LKVKVVLNRGESLLSFFLRFGWAGALKRGREFNRGDTGMFPYYFFTIIYTFI